MVRLTKDATDQPPVRVERANSDAWRVIVTGQLVGFALRMTNGGWCAFDTDDRRISPIHFERPSDVGRHFLAQSEAGRQALEAHHEQ